MSLFPFLGDPPGQMADGSTARLQETRQPRKREARQRRQLKKRLSGHWVATGQFFGGSTWSISPGGIPQKRE